jgi:hypothetical protein
MHISTESQHPIITHTLLQQIASQQRFHHPAIIGANKFSISLGMDFLIATPHR